MKFENEFELGGYKFFSENNKSWASIIILENDTALAQKTAIQGIENSIISIEKLMKTPIHPYLTKISFLNGAASETMDGIVTELNVRRTVCQKDINELLLDVAIMQKDENYKKALLLWTKPPVRTWNELSKIIELVKHRANIDPITEGWLSKGDQDAFSASANNESISGVLNARHAKKYGDPPKNTMTLERGEEVIQSLLNSWKNRLLENM